MFTGLIEEIGTVKSVLDENGSIKLTLRCTTVLEGTVLGDSIAINGCCLTVTDLQNESFAALATPETLALTNLGQLKEDSPVNLERSLTLEKRIGGHIVQGHVDGTAKVVSITPEGDSQRWTFSLDEKLRPFLVMKGSITVNGVSLTIAGLTEDFFAVALIPKTLELTTFGQMELGDMVNLETDIMGKYVYQYLQQMNG